MATPLRGTSTSESQLHITWTELTGTDTGGAAIDSYNVRWDKGSETWEDIAGEEGNYLVATSYIHSADVSAGAVYKVTVRAHNAHGWGPESAYLEITAAEGPETPDSPTTVIHNHYVRI